MSLICIFAKIQISQIYCFTSFFQGKKKGGNNLAKYNTNENRYLFSMQQNVRIRKQFKLSEPMNVMKHHL